ncbi:uncharacterized protein LOC144467532 [Augochlora pura]
MTPTMLTTGILTLMVLLLSQHDNVKGSPLDNYLFNNELDDDTDTLQSNLDRRLRSHHTWMLPISSVSISNLFKDNGGDAAALMKAVETIQKNQKEMLKLLNQFVEVSQAAPCQSPSNNDDFHRETENSHRETEDCNRETDDSHRETKDSHGEIKDSHKETKDFHREIKDSHKETEDSKKETEDSKKETEDSNKETEDLTYNKLKPTIIDILDNKTEIANSDSNILSGSHNRIIYDNLASDEKGRKLMQMDNEAYEGSGNKMEKNFKGMPLAYDGDGSDA